MCVDSRESAAEDLLLGRLDFGVLAAETLHATGSIQQLLFAREEGMAAGADFNVDVAPVGRTGAKAIAARAHHAYFVVTGMDSSLHNSLNLNANIRF